MVLSILLYGCESWALTAVQLERLEVFHRSCLRQILGLRRRDHVSNDELYRRCGKKVVLDDTEEIEPLECIAMHIRRRALRWLGHLGRMSDARLAKQLLWAALPEGIGRTGRPTQPLLPQVYHSHLLSLDITSQRRAWQYRRQQEGESIFGFCWLHACEDRDTWRALVN